MKINALAQFVVGRIGPWRLRPGNITGWLLFLTMLLTTPWLFEQWTINSLQNRLQTSSVNYSQQLELHLENLERSILRRIHELDETSPAFERHATEWLDASHDLVVVQWVNPQGKTLKYAARTDWPKSADDLNARQRLALAHALELNAPSYSSIYEVMGKRLVDLYVPLARHDGQMMVVSLDTATWSNLPTLQDEMRDIAVDVIAFTTTPAIDKHHFRINHPLWHGHWTLEFKSREVTAEILKVSRPVFAFIALVISVMMVLHLRNHRLRLRAEHDAIEKSRLLEKQSRLSMLGEMSASLAHEINQPLTIISNYAAAGQMQLHQSPDVDLLSSLLQKIQEQSQRAAQVLVSVRALLHQGPVQTVRIDVAQLLANLQPHMQAQGQPLGVGIRINTSAGLFALIDPILFEQVVLNLFKNSLQALEKSTSSPKTIQISAAIWHEKLQITIEDSGPGIAPEHEHKIFDSFFTTKEDGLGIGLNLCRSVIERFQGRLVLRSNSTRGATFLIELPLAAKDEAS